MRTREQRKLDSLARLLERDFTCAAVCSFDGKLFIATNKHTSNSYDETNNKLLTVVESVKKGYFEESDFDLFGDIVLNNVKSLAQGKLTFDYNEIKAIAKKMLSKEGMEAWGKTTANDLKAEYKTRSRASDAFFIGSIAERLAIDFLKVKQEFLDDNKENLLHQGLEVELLPASDKDVHAEMTILGKLLELIEEDEAPKQAVYIGISKKCCRRCMDVIESFNLTNQLQVFLSTDDSDEEAEEAEEPEMTQKETLALLSTEDRKKIEQGREEAKMILVSGSHAQKQPIAHYDAQKKKRITGWMKPLFLTRDSDGIDVKQAAAAGLTDDLIDEYESEFPENAQKDHQTGKDFDMDTEASDSPPPSPKY